ncbi:unnamed protein product [Prorocentrum cordatum]|uniref:Acyltransferase n=1 Tax=Prorocentrum cordatum TaxID=2364126 RepID=A0ABN9TVJ3_9DINO|nr:unnamed protein product [Polarella glacialis]
MELARLPPLGGLAPRATPAKEAAVIATALLAINAPVVTPLLLAWLWRRSRGRSDAAGADDAKGPRRARALFWALLLAFVALALAPMRPRPGLMQSRFWRWWLEYFSVRVVHKSGKPLPLGQYFYCFTPHGLYPFSGAMACVSKMVDVFPRMRIISAAVGTRVPMVRQLMGWINVVLANRNAIRSALSAGDSVAVFPGGIAEMVRTSASSEQLVLQGRKGFVRLALEHGVPIVPVYVFGQSLSRSHLRIPGLETLSRLLRASLVLPYGRFGLLVPRRLPLLYAVGDPIGPAVGAGAAGVTQEIRSTRRTGPWWRRCGTCTSATREPTAGTPASSSWVDLGRRPTANPTSRRTATPTASRRRRRPPVRRQRRQRATTAPTARPTSSPSTPLAFPVFLLHSPSFF